MESAEANGTAHDATVQAGPPDPGEVARQRRREYVQQLKDELAAMEDKLAGWKDAVVSKKAELKQARAEGEE